MKANAYQVCILTVFIAATVHLDGSGASTFLIVIPALLPIYERLSIRKTSMLLIITSAMGGYECYSLGWSYFKSGY